MKVDTKDEAVKYRLLSTYQSINAIITAFIDTKVIMGPFFIKE